MHGKEKSLLILFLFHLHHFFLQSDSMKRMGFLFALLVSVDVCCGAIMIDIDCLIKKLVM